MKRLKLVGLIIVLLATFVAPSYAATIYDTIQFRRGTASAWTTADPVLGQGEPAWETDTGRMKVGDGATHWVSLSYYPTIAYGEWIVLTATPTYYSATQFKVSGNVTATFPTSIRVRAQVSAGTIYGSVSSSSATGSPSVTTVTVTWDAGQLDTGLSEIAYGILSPTNTSIPVNFTVATVPAGTVIPYAGASAPSGYLLCYGQAVSRTTYATLFAAIGVAYGTGDGSLTFNVPDLRGRNPLGMDNMGGSAANRVAAATSLGSGAGTETITVSAHTHGAGSFAGPSHTHTLPIGPYSSQYLGWLSSQTSGTFTGAGVYDVSGNADPSNTYSKLVSDAAGTGAVTGTSASGGSSTPASMNPYLTLNYVIKF